MEIRTPGNLGAREQGRCGNGDVWIFPTDALPASVDQFMFTDSPFSLILPAGEGALWGCKEGAPTAPTMPRVCERPLGCTGTQRPGPQRVGPPRPQGQTERESGCRGMWVQGKAGREGSARCWTRTGQRGSLVTGRRHPHSPASWGHFTTFYFLFFIYRSPELGWNPKQPSRGVGTMAPFPCPHLFLLPHLVLPRQAFRLAGGRQRS